MAKDRSRGGTPATALLQRAGIEFQIHEFDHDPTERNYGVAAAAALGVDPDRVFKTLLSRVEGRTDGVAIVVGIVPVSGQLSLKDLAAAMHAKRAELCDPADAERVTGYVVGGISPFGQKRRLPTAIDETCRLFDSVFVSGGKRGLDLELAPDDLVRVLDAVVASIGVAH